MSYLRLCIFAVFIFLNLTLASASESEKKVQALPKADEVLRHLDYLYRSDAAISEVSMSIKTPEWERKMEIKIWSRGLDDTLIRIISPAKDAGIATLKQGNQMWNYFPKINRVMKVPPSMMMSSWMGSDLTNDDLVREVSWEKDYKTSISRDGQNLKLELVPHEKTVTVWSKIVMTVNGDNWLPIEQIYYNERNEALRKIEFDKVKTINDRTIPMQMMVIPLNKKGHSTTLEYRSIDFKPKLDDDIFSLRNLKRP